MIDALPPAPDPNSPSTFEALASAFAAALPTFGTQANALAAAMTALAAGGAFAIPYTFSNQTADSDPGAGKLCLDNFAAQTSATVMRCDLLGSDGTDYTSELAAFATSTSAVKGRLRLFGIGGSTARLSGDFTALATPAGYRNLTITNVTGSAAAPFANGDGVVLFFQPNGDKGDTGGFGIGADTPSTGSVTLTNSSVAAQRVQATALGQCVTLPDATTMISAQKGVPIFAITNVGDYPMGVKDAAGNVRGFVRAYSTVSVALHDISTAAGLWGLESAALVAVSGSYKNTALSLGTTTKMKAIAVDADRDLILFGDTTLEAIVFNKATATWGTPQQVRATITTGQFDGLLVAADKVMAISFNSTAEEATILSLSGTTITVGTPGTSTIAAAITLASRLSTPVLVGASVFMGYVRGSAGASQAAVQGIAVSGATATIGTDVAIGGAAGSAATPHVYVSGSNGVAVVADGTNLTGRSYTINGSTGALTGGTAGTQAVGTDLVRTVAVGSRWVAILTGGGGTSTAHIISLSGTTITVGAAVASALTANADSNLDAIVVGSKVVLSGLNTTARFNILTDTAGTLTAGTSIAIANSTAVPAYVSTSGTNLRYAASDGRTYTIDASGASPTAAHDLMQANTTTVSYPAGQTGVVNSPRHYRNLTIGTRVLSLPTTLAQFAALEVGVDDQRVRPLDVMGLGTYGVAGVNAFESYVAESTLTNGFFLKRVQAAQP